MTSAITEEHRRKKVSSQRQFKTVGAPTKLSYHFANLFALGKRTEFYIDILECCPG